MMESKAIIFSLIALLGTAALFWAGYRDTSIGHDDEHEHEKYFQLTASQSYSGGSEQHEQARHLKQQGDILPLEKILASANDHHPGRVLETELYRRGQDYVYEVELLDESGKVWELVLDASTGELIKEEQED